MFRYVRQALVIIIIGLVPAASWAYDLTRQVTEFTLPNGMKWLLVRRTQAPVFSGMVMVRVGGADEKDGKTGLAHMFEHMAFKGSSRIGTRDYAKERPILDEIERVGEELTKEQQKPKPDAKALAELAQKLASLQKEEDAYQKRDEVSEVMERNGGADLNAYTSKDVTTYHSSMPVTRLKLWARVTADMIFDPVYREFYIERNVVAEERSRYMNTPDGAMEERIFETAYSSGPYRWSTIGFEKDILGLTIGDARNFHDNYYVPGNMVGVLVGDLNISETEHIIRATFGAYERKLKPQGPASSGEPRAGIADRFHFNAEPSLAVGYHKPAFPDPAEYTFDVIASLMCEGRSSRLQKRLIYEKKMAQSIYCSDGEPGLRLANMFLVWIDPLKPYKPDNLLKEVEAEMAKLVDQPVDASELERVRKNVTSTLIFSLEDNMGMASGLARFETIFGDWRLLADYPKHIAKVNAEDVQKVARKYLIDGNRVVVERLKGKQK